MDEWALEFGSSRPQRVSSLVNEVVDGRMAARMSDNQRAAAAWYRANGDRERSHTTSVFLRSARIKGAAPVLGVYVDSHAMVTDFGVNKDIYLARLANVGFEVSGIEFLPARGGRARTQSRGTAKRPQQPLVLPELSAEERARVDTLVAQLPASLREKASKAMITSMQREKLESTLIDKQS